LPSRPRHEGFGQQPRSGSPAVSGGSAFEIRRIEVTALQLAADAGDGAKAKLRIFPQRVGDGNQEGLTVARLQRARGGRGAPSAGARDSLRSCQRLHGLIKNPPIPK
jgi:hypothetical protein